jgi:hypothetical protein
MPNCGLQSGGNSQIKAHKRIQFFILTLIYAHIVKCFNLKIQYIKINFIILGQNNFKDESNIRGFKRKRYKTKIAC